MRPDGYQQGYLQDAVEGTTVPELVAAAFYGGGFRSLQVFTDRNNPEAVVNEVRQDIREKDTTRDQAQPPNH